MMLEFPIHLVLRLSTTLILSVPLPGSKAQDSVKSATTESSAEAPSPEPALVEGKANSVLALESVRDSIKSIDDRIAGLVKAEKTATPLEKEPIDAEIKSLAARREVLKADFESIATGIDPSEYDQATSVEFVLKDELDALLRPIIEEIKDLTEKPREIEQLRSELTSWRKRLSTTESALSNLATIPGDLSAELAEEITETRNKWNERRQQAENRIQALTYQLEQAERNQPSLFKTVSSGFRGFFRSRGRNLLLCFAVFLIAYFALRYLHQRVNHFAPWQRKGKRPFYIRIVDVGLNIFSVVGAVIAALLVLYATGDWVLMGLAIIVLVGLALAAKNGLPQFYDHARILLNLGEVREGERVIFNGVPWRIERLSFYSVLVNEQLRGGTLRLPVRQLSGLISRAVSEDGELWFPCSEGDWVDLPDLGKARVIAQTPEYVQLVKLGGAKITMPTADFLTSTPTNLSHNFRISTTFGIDYRYQAESTTTIPEKMWSHLKREIAPLISNREQLLSLKVEFASAGASSLDYAIIADFDGALAPRFEFLARALQRLAVDCCNQNHWEIPFTQITLHNAYPQEEKAPLEMPEKKPKLP